MAIKVGTYLKYEHVYDDTPPDLGTALNELNLFDRNSRNQKPTCYVLLTFRPKKRWYYMSYFWDAKILVNRVNF